MLRAATCWPMEDMLMMTPLRRFTISRATAWVTRKQPLRLVSRIASHSASLISRKGVRFMIPALLTRMSIRPSVWITRSTIARTSPPRPTSALPAMARRASASIAFTADRASPAAVDLRVGDTERGAEPGDRARRRRQPRHHVAERESAEHGVGDRHEALARPAMRVGEDLGRIVDGT